MNFIIQLAIYAITTVLTEYLKPNPFNKPKSLSDFDFPTADESRAIPYVAGTVRIDGANIIDEVDFQVEKVKKRPWTAYLFGLSGFLFPKRTVALRYHVGLVFGLCLGTVDAIRKITYGDKIVWTGNVSSGLLTIDQPRLFGGDKDQGGIVGVCEFYPGTYTQMPSAYLEQFDPDYPALRGLSYFIFQGPSGVSASSGYIGNSENVRAFKFEIERFPAFTGASAWKNIASGDANPAAIMWDWMTSEDFGAGIPESRLALAKWQAAAQQFHLENLGASVLIDQSTEVESVIHDFLKLTDSTIFTNLSTGLIEIYLARLNYEIGDLLVLNEDNFELESYTRGALDETINQVIVPFRDRLGDFVDRNSTPQQDDANAKQQNAVVALSSSHIGISTLDLADRIADRDLRALSSNLAKIKGKAKREAVKLAPGQAFVFSWPEDPAIDGMVMRISSRNPGSSTDNGVKIEAIEDVFNLAGSPVSPETSTVWTNPVGAPQQTANTGIAEQTYFTSGDDLAHIEVYAQSPDKSHYGFDLYAKEGAGDFELKDDDGDFCPTGTLLSDYTDATASVDNSGALVIVPSADMDKLIAATAADIAKGKNLFKIQSATTEEFCAFESFTVDGSGRYVLSNVHRGLLDTVQQRHPAGARVWFVSFGHSAPPDVFTVGATVSAKVAPLAVSGAADESAASVVTVTIAGRARRPIVAGRFRINGNDRTLASIPATGDVLVSWEHRDRKAGRALDQSDASIVYPEAGTTYTLKIYGDANAASPRVLTGLIDKTFTYTNAMEVADFGALQGVLTFVLFAVRDGVTSYQAQRRVVQRPGGSIPSSYPAFSPSGSYAAPPSGNATAIGGVPVTGTPTTTGQTIVFNQTTGRYEVGAGGSGGHTIQDEGVNQTSRSKLNFVGSYISAGDDAGADATKIMIDDAGLRNRANHTGAQTISTVTGLQTALDAKIDLTQKAAANGVASLDASGKVPAAQLPSSGGGGGSSEIQITSGQPTDVPAYTTGYRPQRVDPTDKKLWVFVDPLWTFVDLANAPTSWIPSDETGLSFWFEPRFLTGLSDGNAIGATWADQGSAGNNLSQPTSTRQFIYKAGILNGQPVARGDLSNGTRMYRSSSVSCKHLFIVAKYNGGLNFPNYVGLVGDYSNDIVFVANYGTSNWFGFTQSGTYRKDGVIITGTPSAANLGSFHLYEYESASNLTPTGLMVGDDRTNDLAARIWNGDIALIVGFDHQLSSAVAVKMRIYINQILGI